MTPRLYLHVGFMKTGTSYLQSVFWNSLDALAAQGLDLVPGTPFATHQLMLDVTGRYQPGEDPPAVVRAVERLPGLLAASTTPRALVTSETLIPADDQQIARLLAACGSHEVHVVLTVRDLARQIPSSWQQRLRRGSPEPYDDFLARLRRTEGSPKSRLWKQKDLVAALERWGRHVPRERIHVVTVPPPGGEPEELLRRFCSVLAVDPAQLCTDATRANEALGHVGAELLRRVNSRIDDRLKTRRLFGEVGKRYFALGVIGSDSGRRIKLPEEYAEWCQAVSERYADHLRTGYHVVGDPDDLLPVASAFTSEPHLPTDAELAEAGADALAAVLTDRLERR
ncbi:MAG: hypothetical protein ACRDOZ_03320, partial [Nocardioides sp.]